jgi:hypothetical protein
MKLNNKGFAFSTLLYGLLAVILVIMAVLLGMYRKSNDESYYYSSILEENLNKCVEQEIALENCYRNNEASCSAEAYYSCLGYDDLITKAKKVNFQEELTKLVVPSGSGLREIDTEHEDYNLKYVYQGNEVDNYVKFSGKNWRIVGITKNGEIKLVLPDALDEEMAWDIANNTEWTVPSSLNAYLNNDFYNSLTGTAHIKKYDWDIGRIDFTEVSSLKKNEFKDVIANAKYGAKVGLLSPSDYAYTTLTGCAATSTVYNTAGCTGDWLASYGTWFINSSKTDQGKAYYYNTDTHTVLADSLQTTVDGNIVVTKHKVLPAIYLSSDVNILEDLGDGKSGTPYIVEG